MTLYGSGFWRRHTAVSGADGAFSLPGLTDGRYRVQASRQGYVQADSGREVTVEGGPVHGLEVRLSSGGAIAGRLLGLTLDDLPRVEVTARGAQGWGRGSVSHDAGYRISGLAPGSWRVEAEIPGSGRRAQGSVTLEPGEEEASLDLEFGAGLALSGRVSRGGEPAAGMTVEVRGLETVASGSALTDRNGRFAVEGLEAGRYGVEVWERFGVQHREEVLLDGDREIEIRLAVGEIRGRVVDAADAAPVDGASIGLEDPAGSGAGAGGRPSRLSEVRSDSTGRFALYGVPAGVHRLVARKPGYAPASTDVQVGERESVEGVELRLTATEGLVLTIGSSAALPIRGLRVAVLDPAGRVLLSDYHVAAEGGRVRVSSVPPGRWTAVVAAGDHGVAEVDVAVPGPPVPLTLEPAGRLEAVVPELAGTPVQATLTLVGPGGRPFRVPGWGNQVRSEWPLFEGKARVSGLAPGAWTAIVTAADGRTWRSTAAVPAGATVEVALE